VAAGETEGFVKTVFDGKTGALIGAHMIGHEVTEMIQGFVTAITLEATEEDLHGIVYAHPTMSEAMHEGAALDAYGRSMSQDGSAHLDRVNQPEGVIGIGARWIGTPAPELRDHAGGARDTTERGL
jgi:hypothetical protein